MIARTHEVTIWRQSGTATGRGGARTRSYAALATAVECNLQPKSGGLRQMAFGREPESMHRAFFPPGTDIQSDDEITVTLGEYDPTQFKVLFVGHQTGKWDIECDLSQSVTKLS